MDPLNIQDNISFLAKLPPDAVIGVDKKGRLYAVTGIKKGIHKITSAWHSQQKADLLKKASSQVLAHLNLKRITSASETAEFQRLIKNVKKLALFGEDVISEAVDTWYTQQYTRLVVDARMHPQVAEAYITITMSYDQNIPLSEEFRAKIAPLPTNGGVGGSYFIHNQKGETIGVFKPSDEEVGMPNNPYGLNSKQHQQARGQDLGDSCNKEIAAYLIDKGAFAGVPFTANLNVQFPMSRLSPDTLVPKVGSFQVFIADTVTADIMKKKQIRELKTEQVQRIAIFDLLIGNRDRNLGNLLWHQATNTLIPIDHGVSLLYSLVKADNIDKIRSETQCQWVSWPQIEQAVDPAIKKWIDSLRLDEGKLQQYLSDESILELKMRLTFLKFMLEQGYNIKELSLMMMGVNENALSEKYKNIPCILEDAAKYIYQQYPQMDRTKQHSNIINTLRELLSKAVTDRKFPKPLGGSQ